MLISPRVQKTMQGVSLVLLAVVFWHYYKLKNKIEPATATKTRTAFERGLDCRCDQLFVETPDLTVVKVLPDDTEGTPHQKWIVKSPTGHTILFTHNLKLCARLDLKKGDHLKLGGEFKWTEKGGLIHWAHFDPERQRRDGYIEIADKKICSSEGVR